MGCDGEQTMIGKADAVSVSADVTEKGVRRRERAFGVDDPGLLVEGFAERGKGRKVAQASRGM
jgi:hypothetical protein